jgi:transcriptional regulator with XRE-family HTH domain
MATMLGTKIRELRNARGLTQVELGAKLHKAGSTVRMWEHGNSYPDADTLLALSRLFNVTTDYLLSSVDTAPDTPPEAKAFIEPTPKDRQITKISKELVNLNPKQL